MARRGPLPQNIMRRGKSYVVHMRNMRELPDGSIVTFWETFADDDYKGGQEAAFRDADLCLSRLTALKARGKRIAPDVTATFEEAANRWHAHGVAKGWRASTSSDYRSCLDSRLISQFGDMLIAKLSEQDVEAWLETLRKEVSARSVRKLLFVGGAVFERARHVWPGEWQANPFRAVEPGTKPERLSFEVYSPEEVAAIVRACETPQDKAIILMLANEGLRRGEIPPLQVKDVSFGDRLLHVRRNYVRGMITTPKGKRSRVVPLDDEVARAVEKLLRDRGDPPEDDLLFPGEDGGLLDPTGISHRFKEAVKKAGVRDLHLHALRHGFCTKMAKSGVPEAEIAEWAGHVSTQTTRGYMQFAPKPGDADRITNANAPKAVEAESTEPTTGEQLAELQRQVAELSEQLTRALTPQEA
jgi:integrase